MREPGRAENPKILAETPGTVMELLNDHQRDEALSPMLRSMRVHSAVFCRSRMTAPWGFGVAARNVAAFHILTAGAAYARVDGVEETIRLEAGDMVVLPTGRAHQVTDDPRSPVTALDDILDAQPVVAGTLHYGGGGAESGVLCGGFSIEHHEANPFLRSLPPFIHVSGASGSPAPWLARTLELLLAEMGDAGPGSEAVIARLCDVLLLQVLRAHLVRSVDPDRGRSLRDPQISEALRLIQDEPERPWTVEELASKVALSRSSFADRFRSLTGESPIRFLARCRLTKAAELLRESDYGLAQIARLTGYESAESLSRAFRRTYGVAPGAYRRA